MRVLLLAGAAVVLSGCVIGDFGPSDRYQTDFHYSFALQPNGRVNVESLNGSIEITGWDENKVDITGTKYASTEVARDSIKIETHSAPDSIEIRTVKPSSGFSNMGARYTIRVPRTAELERITTSNAAIRIKDVGSAAHLKTSNGSIRVENVLSDVDAKTSNSSIELDSVQGSATMKTSNGRIRAENIGRNCEAETSNNSIEIRLDQAPAAPIRLTTSNGSVDLKMSKRPKNDIRIQTRNSAISVHLPLDTGARVAAETSNSSISSEFDVARSDENKKNHLEGTIGAGGPSIELMTSNGPIRISKGRAD